MVAAIRSARSWWAKHPRRAVGMAALVTATAVLFGALSALAATITYDPTGVSETAWTRLGGTTSAGVLADTSDATYMYATTANSPMYVAMADPSGMSGVITNVTVYVRAAESGTGTPPIILGVGDGNALIAGGWAAATHTLNGTTMVEYSDSWASDPRGGAWTWTDIASLQGVVEKDTTTSTSQVRIGKMWIVVEYTTDTTPPTLDSASATDATHVAVVFSEAIDAATVAAADFSIPGLTISGVSVSGSTVTLTTSVQDAIGYTVSCALGNVADAAGNGNTAGSANFTGIDGIAPTLLSAASIDATHVEVQFSEAIAAGSVAAGDFTIPGLTVSGVSVSGSIVTLTTSIQDAINYTVTCGAGAITDAAGNGNTAGSDTFTGTDGIAPTLVSATSSDATHVSVVFSEPLAPGSVTDTDFSIPGLTVTGVSVSGSTVTLTTTTQDSVSYTLTCAAGRVTDAAGNGNTAGSSTFAGTDGVRPQVISALSTGSTSADVIFSEDLDAATLAADGSDFTITGLTITAAVLDADGVTVHLTTTVQDGISYTVGCLADVLADVAGNGNASGSATFTGTDGIAPLLSSAYAVDATHVDVVFSESLQAGSIAAGDFAVPGLTVSAATLDADGVTVHLTTSVQAGGTDYTLTCAAGRVLDVAGNGNQAGTADFIGYDTTPPVLSSATAPNATHVEVVFSEPLDAASITASDFAISGLTVLAAVLDADGITARLTTSAQGAGVAYSVTCAAGSVLDRSGIGNTAGSATFTGSSVTDSQPPTDPADVTAVAGGSSPTIASVTWTASTDDIGVAGYRIYRSTSATGPFGAIGTTTALSFADVTGVPGQEYWYSVEAFDAAGNASSRVLAAGVPVVATWTIEPHDAYAADTRLCKLCHEPHEAATADDIFRPTGAEPGETGVCYACHDGSGATDNIKTGAVNSFTGGSGHAIEGTDPAADLTNRCSSCHGPHRDYTSSPMLPKQAVNGVPVATADNTWCFACHDASASWYAAGTYPDVAEPSRDATGYPVSGTFPGPATYADTTANPHASIPASATLEREAGDCLYCHNSHRAVSAYDGLVAEYTVPTEGDPASAAYGEYAEACFVCHGATNTYGFATQPTNIEQYITAGGERSGHRIETAGGTYAVGTPLPCYECHNPHGSTRGNEMLFSDALGKSLKVTGANTAEAALNVREFCFTCHTTGDAVPMAWDSAANGGAGDYVGVSNTDTIVGLYRDGHTATAAVNRLRLPAVAGHYEADTQSCGSCHGSDYGTGGANVHNPTGGASDGGIACYACHNYQANMEDLAGAKAGDPLLLDDSAHHVMGGSGVEGDIAPKDAATGYPTSQNDVYCVSCHTDHNYFNGNKGANLRTDLSSTSGASAANTDFIASNPSGGICLSCHTTTKSKQNMGTEQLNAGAATTPAIDRAAYDASAHDYTVPSTFGTSTFDANCSKCHSDEQTKEYSSASGYRFGTHWSTKVGILGALGASLPALPKADVCLSCHNDTAQPYGGVIAAPANTTADEFAMTSTHDLTKVTCVNCHNVHEASAAAPAADPANTYNVASLGTPAGVNSYCLTCHTSAALPAQTITAATLVPYAVGSAPNMNVGTYPVSGHGAVTPLLDCRDCHEQHGSTLGYLLSTTVDAQPVSSYQTLPNASGLADQAQCLACHRAGGMAASANISQYYPASAGGTAAANMTRSGHRIVNGIYAGQAVPCRACHNPHGGASGGYMLVIRTNINGTDTIIGDQAGELAMSAVGQETAANIRRFCLACHVTSDATGQGWNGAAMVNITSGSVLGVSRTGGLLKLPARKGHAAADTDSCYVCHGDDFTQATSVNVHNPASGESLGGIACYKCHTVYRDQMEDVSGTEQGGAARTQTYHHVLGNGVTDGDNAFTATTYPTSVVVAPGDTGVYCLSCHVDHDKFSPLVNSGFDRSNNLRADYTASSPTATNTDFNSTGNTSVCLGCHATALAKDTDDQKPESSSTRTPVITAAQFGASAHDYYATSTFQDSAGTTSTFNANCAKCHDSEIDGGGMEKGTKTSGYQSSANRFSVHTSENRRILAAMGVPLADPPGEEVTCYQCHSTTANGFKTTANDDWYGASSTTGGTMNAVSQAIYGMMSSTYKHNVGSYSGLHRPSATDETQAYIAANKHVECADCHNVHATTSTRHAAGTNAVSGTLTGVSGVSVTYPAGAAATNFTGATGFAQVTATAEYQICFKCHSSANSAYASWGGTGAAAWTDVALDFSTNNGSYHPVVAALPATDPGQLYGSSRLDAGQLTNGWTPGETMYCSDCHASSSSASLGPHGSSVKWMLAGTNQAWPYTTSAANGTSGETGLRPVSGRATSQGSTNGLFCLNCHILTGTVHSTGQHNNVACVGCHVRVPHGSKTSRLLQVFNNASGTFPYTMPARMTAQGNGATTTTMRGNIITHAYKDGWGEGACTMTGGTSESECGGGHNNTQTNTDARW